MKRELMTDHIVALAEYLECDVDDIRETTYNLYGCGYGFAYGVAEYVVCTEDEADSAFHESIEQYVDECVLDSLPEQYRYYFDYEKFERDVRLSDGRGPSLAGYDSEENEEKVGDEWYFIYRTN